MSEIKQAKLEAADTPGFVLYGPAYFKQVIKSEAEAAKLPYALVASGVNTLVSNLAAKGLFLVAIKGTNLDAFRQEIAPDSVKGIEVFVRLRHVPGQIPPTEPPVGAQPDDSNSPGPEPRIN